MEEQKPILERFLLEYFQVTEMHQIDPWKFVGPVECWEPIRTVTIKSVHQGPGESFVSATKNVRNPFQGRPYDFERVNLRTWQCLSAKNGATHSVVQSNFVPKPYKRQIEQRDAMLEAAGVPRGTVLRLEPNFDSSVNQPIFQCPETDFFLSQGFCRTTGCITQDNVMNGIIKLTPELCVDLPKQVDVANLEHIMVPMEVEHYYLVPRNHVLSWMLQIDHDTRISKGMFALDMSCKDPADPHRPKFLFYVVADKTMGKLVHFFMHSWLDKVDLRPLASLGLKIEGQSVLRTSVTCNVWPQMSGDDVRSLRPTLHESITPYYEFLRREMYQKLSRPPETNE